MGDIIGGFRNHVSGEVVLGPLVKEFQCLGSVKKWSFLACAFLRWKRGKRESCAKSTLLVIS